MITLLKSIKRIFETNKLTITFLIFGLTLSMLMISLGSSYVGEILKISSKKSEATPPNGIMVRNTMSNEYTHIDDVLSLLKFKYNNTGIILNGILIPIDNAGSSNYFEVSGEFFEGDTNWQYPLVKGRYYTIDEVLNGEKVILIGKSMMTLTEKIDNKEYLSIAGEKYEVIGVVGYKNNKSSWDNRVFIPAKSLPSIIKNKINGSNFTFAIYNENNVINEELIFIKNILKDAFPTTNIDVLGELKIENNIENLITSMDILFLIAFLVYAVSLINTINIISYWAIERKYEIGVKKVLGHTTKQIGKEIFNEILTLNILSFIIALIIQLILKFTIDNIFGYTLNIYITNIIIGVIGIYLTSLIASIYPITKALKVQPIECLKG